MRDLPRSHRVGNRGCDALDPELMTEILSRQLRDMLAELRDRHGTIALGRVEEFVRVMIGEKHIRPPERLQRPELYFFPGLPSRAWHEEPPIWMARLEEAWPVIRRELDGLLAAPASFVPYAKGSDSSYREEKFRLRPRSENWTIYDLHEPAAEEQCPETMALLRTIFRFDLGEPVTAQFSALRAGSRIPPHCGVANFFLTAHLGLITPGGCRIRVGTETRGWTEGKGFVFDDSFEHEVWHDGDATRIVLVARFWHPALSEVEIEALGMIHERVIELTGESTAEQREALARLRGDS